MLRLVLLDLGDTLVRGGELFPHVIPALEAIAQLETADGEPLVSGLVSDYPLAEPPAARGAAEDEAEEALQPHPPRARGRPRDAHERRRVLVELAATPEWGNLLTLYARGSAARSNSTRISRCECPG